MHGRIELLIEFASGRHSRGWHAHRLGQFHEVNFRVAKVQHVERFLIHILGTYAGEFDLQDQIFVVTKDYNTNVKLFPRHGSQGLKRVHGATITVQTNYFSIGTSDRTANSVGQTKTDCAPRQEQPVMA